MEQGRKKVADEASQASIFDNEDEVSHTKGSQDWKGGHHNTYNNPQKPVKLMCAMNGGVTSCDEDVDVVGGHMVDEGEGRHHIQRGEQDEAIGEETEGGGVSTLCEVYL